MPSRFWGSKLHGDMVTGIEADQYLLFLTVFLPLAAAALAPTITRHAGRAAAPLLSLAPLTVTALLALSLPQIADGAVLLAGIDWLPGFSVRLSFRADGLSAAFALLVAGIGFLVILYAGGYMRGHAGLGRLQAFLLLFMSAMLGLVLADDAITLFVFWEATSIASFLLIGFDRERERARRAAFQALVITGLGGLCLLAGLIVAGEVVGDRSLTGLLASGEALRSSALYPVILTLILGAAFTKSAQVPFHVWLPNAMEAPTPVSAYLHSATMVKAGVYLLMRFQPVLGGTHAWETFLPFVGSLTLVTGAVLALRQTDLKLMLAQTTVASLGLMVLLVGIGGDQALVAAALYLVAHALFKGALFMVAGAIDHGTGSRDIRRLSGLARLMPMTFAAAAIAALSMAGLPPFLGFVAKETLYGGLLAHGAPVEIVAAVIGNALMFAVAGLVGLRPFLGALRSLPHHPHDGSPELLAGPLLLALKGLTAALMLAATSALIIAPMASMIAGRPLAVELHLLPSRIDAPLMLSLVTIALGIAAYLLADRLRGWIDRALTILGWGPDKGFDQAISGLLGLSALISTSLQSGRLKAYMTATFAVVALALLLPLTLFDDWPALPTLPVLRLHEALVLLLAITGIGAVLTSRSRLIAIVALGAQGFAVALLYLMFGAPDLAFTQIMVETLSVVVLALVMTRLSLHQRDRRGPSRVAVDGVIALAAGTGFAALLLKATQLPFDDHLSAFFAANSYAVAHGRNIVNVIIVDFRALDTLGEIAVVMVVGLAVLALVRVRGRSIITVARPRR